MSQSLRFHAMSPHPHVMVVGGLGGSGTRAIAGAIERLGYAHGPALNMSRDCLTFTYLFVRTGWMPAPMPNKRDRLDQLRRITEDGLQPDQPEFKALSNAVTCWTAPTGSDPFLIKEPNTWIFADTILEHWPDAAFVFVHRNPLDMAVNQNTNQLKRWGPERGIDPVRLGSVPAAQLALWIDAYKQQQARMKRFANRTTLLDYDAFVCAPEDHLTELFTRLGSRIDPNLLSQACTGIITPSSQGRGRETDLSLFSKDQLTFCRAHGWL